LLPLLTSLYFSVSDISSRWRTVNEMGALEKTATLTVKISAFVHEAQKERGLTSGFLGSQGQSFAREIQTQRAETDKYINDLKAALQQSDTSQLTGERKAKLTDM